MQANRFIRYDRLQVFWPVLSTVIVDTEGPQGPIFTNSTFFLFWTGPCKTRSLKSDFVQSSRHVGHTRLRHLLYCSIITATDG